MRKNADYWRNISAYETVSRTHIKFLTYLWKLYSEQLLIWCDGKHGHRIYEGLKTGKLEVFKEISTSLIGNTDGQIKKSEEVTSRLNRIMKMNS